MSSEYPHSGPITAQHSSEEVHLAETRRARQLQHALSQIEKALMGLRFGQVTVTVQDGVVVQIDRLERNRLQRDHG